MPLKRLRRFIQNRRRARLSPTELAKLSPQVTHYYNDNSRVNIQSSKMMQFETPGPNGQGLHTITHVKNAKVDGRKVGDLLINQYSSEHPKNKIDGISQETIQPKTGVINRVYNNGFDESVYPQAAGLAGDQHIVVNTPDIDSPASSFTAMKNVAFTSLQDRDGTLRPEEQYAPALRRRSDTSLKLSGSRIWKSTPSATDHFGITNPSFNDPYGSAGAYISTDDIANIPENRRESTLSIDNPYYFSATSDKKPLLSSRSSASDVADQYTELLDESQKPTAAGASEKPPELPGAKKTVYFPISVPEDYPIPKARVHVAKQVTEEIPEDTSETEDELYDTIGDFRDSRA